MDCVQERVIRWTALQPLNLYIEYDPSIIDLLYDVLMQPVASESIQIIFPQAVVHFYVKSVLQPCVERALVVWCVAVVAVSCQIRLIDGGLG
jgi:hypothetical protein